MSIVLIVEEVALTIALKDRVLKSPSMRPMSGRASPAWERSLAAHDPSGGVSRCGICAANDAAFSYAIASFSAPELADILCGTTDIRHVFSRGCCSSTDAPGLVMA
jgi:hypothetical protein